MAMNFSFLEDFRHPAANCKSHLDTPDMKGGDLVLKIFCIDGQLQLYASSATTEYQISTPKPAVTVKSIKKIEQVVFNIIRFCQNELSDSSALFMQLEDCSFDVSDTPVIKQSINFNEDGLDVAKQNKDPNPAVMQLGDCSFDIPHPSVHSPVIEQSNQSERDGDDIKQYEDQNQNDVQPFLCLYCSKCFISKSDYVNHETDCLNENCAPDATKQCDNGCDIITSVTNACNSDGNGLEFQENVSRESQDEYCGIDKTHDVVGAGDEKEGKKKVEETSMDSVQETLHRNNDVCSEREITHSGDETSENFPTSDLYHDPSIDCTNETTVDTSATLKSESITKHLDIASGDHIALDSYECPVKTCESRFDRFDLYILHMTRAHRDSKTLCPFCGKGFDYKHNLKRHIMIHKGKKPFVCQYCFKGFTQKGSLRTHMLRHFSEPEVAATAVDPDGCSTNTLYKCSVNGCIKMFASNKLFMEHMIAHKRELSPNTAPLFGEEGTQEKVVLEPSADDTHLVGDTNIVNNNTTDKNDGFSFAGMEKPNVALEKVSKFECDICGDKFKLKQSLRRHIILHERAKNYACLLCVKSYDKKLELDRHMLSHLTEKPFECETCGANFKRKHSLKVHRMSHYTRTKVDRGNIVSNNGYPCPFVSCSEIFATQLQLSEHTKSCHNCKQCGKSFNNSRSLRRHLLSHSDDRPYECLECHKRYRYKSVYDEHVSQHATQLPQCPMCSRTFTKQSLLENHMKKHDNGQNRESYHCSNCPKAFSSKALLRGHARSHIKPFKCNLCPKTFSTNNALQVHLLKHSGRRDVACPQCSKLFFTKFDLKAHAVVHSGQLNHQCPYCGARFARVSQVNRHMLSHKGERNERCELCAKTFLCKDALRVHMSSHSDDRPFHCSHCPKTFKKKAHMLRHEGALHSEKPTGYPANECPDVDNLNDGAEIDKLGAVDVDETAPQVVFPTEPYLLITTGCGSDIIESNTSIAFQSPCVQLDTARVMFMS